MFFFGRFDLRRFDLRRFNLRRFNLRRLNFLRCFNFLFLLWLWNNCTRCRLLRFQISTDYAILPHSHRLTFISLCLLQHGLTFLTVPFHRAGNTDVLADPINLLLNEVQLIVLMQLLDTILIEVLACLDQVLFQCNLSGAQIGINSTSEGTKITTEDAG